MTDASRGTPRMHTHDSAAASQRRGSSNSAQRTAAERLTLPPPSTATAAAATATRVHHRNPHHVAKDVAEACGGVNVLVGRLYSDGARDGSDARQPYRLVQPHYGSHIQLPIPLQREPRAMAMVQGNKSSGKAAETAPPRRDDDDAGGERDDGAPARRVHALQVYAQPRYRDEELRALLCSDAAGTAPPPVRALRGVAHAQSAPTTTSLTSARSSLLPPLARSAVATTTSAAATTATATTRVRDGARRRAEHGTDTASQPPHDDSQHSSDGALPRFVKATSNAPNEFAYLVARPRGVRDRFDPYDLHVVSHSELRGARCYYTVSAAGVTRFADGTAEFIERETWQRDCDTFRALTTLPVFSEYKRWRSFALWRALVRRHAVHSSRRALTRNLFHVHPHLGGALRAVRGLCMAFAAQNNLFCPASETRSLDACCAALRSHLDVQRGKLERMLRSAREHVEQACKAAMLAARIEREKANVLRGDDDARRKRKVLDVRDMGAQQQQPSYIEKTQHKATCKRLTAFIRLCDYLIIACITRLAARAIEGVRVEVAYADGAAATDAARTHTATTATPSVTAATAAAATAATVAASPQHALPAMARDGRRTSDGVDGECSVRHGPLLLVDVVYNVQEQRIEVVPSRAQVLEAFDEVVRDYVQTADGVPRLVAMDCFKVYTNTSDDVGAFARTAPAQPTAAMTVGSATAAGAGGAATATTAAAAVAVVLPAAAATMMTGSRGGGGGGPDVAEMIMSEDAYVTNVAQMRESLSRAFAAVERYVRGFDVYKDVYVANTHLDVDAAAHAATTMEYFRERLSEYKSQSEAISTRIPSTRDMGLFTVRTEALRECFAPSPVACIAALHRVLPCIAHERNEHVLALLQRYNTYLAVPPKTVEHYVEFLAFYKQLEADYDSLATAYDFVRELFTLLQEEKVDVDEDDEETFRSGTRPQFDKLRTLMQAIEDGKEAQQRLFTRNMDEQMEQLRHRIEAVYDKAGQPIVMSGTADVDEVIAYISELQREAEGIAARERQLRSFQVAIGAEETSVDTMADMLNDVNMKARLWTGIRDWDAFTREMLHVPFEQLNMTHVQDTVGKYTATVKQVSSRLPGNAAVPTLREKVEVWRQLVPVLQALKNPRMKAEHHLRVSNVVGPIEDHNAGNNNNGAAAAATSTGGGAAVRTLAEWANQYTVAMLLDNDVLRFRDEIAAISLAATEEDKLQQHIDKVNALWNGGGPKPAMEFQFHNHRDCKDVYTLVGASVDDVAALLDDTMIAISTIGSSKYCHGILRAQVDRWESRLTYMQATLERWVELQRSWVYLENIFASAEIRSQWKDDAKRFEKVDRFFRDLMRKAHDLPTAYRALLINAPSFDTTDVEHSAAQAAAATTTAAAAAATTTAAAAGGGGAATAAATTAGRGNATAATAVTGGGAGAGAASKTLKTELENYIKELEKVLASLERKLDEKRRAFPRFYFLSNDDLLDILAKVKTPELMMPHMLKMFDGVKAVAFGEGNDMTHLLSLEGERVELVNKGVKARGPVEVWMDALEREMFTSLRRHAQTCLEDYEAHSGGDRAGWMFAHPAQLVLVMEQLLWTRAVEAALDQADSPARMAALRADNHRALEDLAALTSRTLSRVQRIVLSTLITIDVHGRDLVDEMCDSGVVASREFGWAKQLRVYWERADDGHGNLYVRQNNSCFVYGYEYLGAQGRLVITPLTDRIYMTVTGALKLYLGAAPAGPAGTGKTETVKDLAKNLARQCVVYNCSDGVTYKMMEKFFAGLIQTGAWACLDEFNRINIEVLSVIASQLLEIKLALQNGLDTFTFQGTPNVRVRTTYGAFVTMNPGYAGRTELPDNLKVLFRPVAVMTPDFRMIAEVILYSEGFKNARTLSRKITQLYKLSSEQLSPQDHYDFGMRALKSILVMAGDLKRSQPDVDEDLTLIVACNDSNVPKFVADDLPLFRGIMQDLFPGVTFPERAYATLLPAVHEAMAARALVDAGAWLKKSLQFYETMLVRHGVMLVGVTGTGKTEARNVIAAALTSLHAASTARAEGGASAVATVAMAKTVRQFVLNPKSIMLHELYGQLDVNTNEWRDGVLAAIAKECVRASEQSDDRRWIVFDGPVDTLWIESLNSVLDDSKLLCLDSGERVKLPDTIHMLFEVADLAVASPATVSRCGMVYVDAADLPWRALVERWASKTLTPPTPTPPAEASAATATVSATLHVSRTCRRHIVALFDRYVDAGLTWLHQQQLLVNAGDGNVVQSMCDLFAAMLQTNNVQLVCGGGDGGDDTDEGDEDKADDGVTKRKARKRQATRSGHDAGDDDDGGGDNKDDDATTAASYDPAMAAANAKDAHTRECYELCNVVFFFAYVWSVGGNVGQVAMDSFDTLVRGLMETLLPLPHHGTVYDFTVDFATRLLVPWEQRVGRFVYDAATPYFDLLVPTVDTVRYGSLATTLLACSKAFLFSGHSGVGKTVLLADCLRRQSETLQLLPVTFQFSAQTSSQRTQELIESKLKHKRKHVLGAPPGRRVVFFVDDVNMPAREVYGASPPIELLRQLMGHGGFYDRKAAGVWTSVQDVVVIAACGPPEGGRSPLTPRLSRLFHLLQIPSLTDESMRRIFHAILHGFLDSKPFSKEVRELATAVVSVSVDVFSKLCEALRPRPTTPHYTFNLRDLAKLFQGMTQAVPRVCRDARALTRLWAHECMRSFYDRLASVADRRYFAHELLADALARLLPGDTRTHEELLLAAGGGGGGGAADTTMTATSTHDGHANTSVVGQDGGGAGEGGSSSSSADKAVLVWGDFLRFGATERVYEEVTDVQRVRALFDDYQDDYNASAAAHGNRAADGGEDSGGGGGKGGGGGGHRVSVVSSGGAAAGGASAAAPLNLVFFRDHCLHLARIIRILRQPRGNALLVGVGGSGKRSLTRLAAHIAECSIFEIAVGKGYSMADFHEFLLDVYTCAGVQCRPCVLLLSDTQMVHEAMLEDVNNMLNSGEVPAVFAAAEEREKRINACLEAAQQRGITQRDDVFAFFIARVRDHLHVVLAMSPIGDGFRTRCRQFPSLTNCCTVDWFDEWPSEALRAVAARQLQELLEVDAATATTTTMSTAAGGARAGVVGGGGGGDDEDDAVMPAAVRAVLPQLCVDVHTTTCAFAQDYWEQLRRRYYVTPTSYLEFMDVYKRLYSERRGALAGQLSRVQNGTAKMRETDETIATMRGEIELRRPLLEKASRETEAVVADLQTRQARAAEVQVQVRAQQESATTQQREASRIAADANERLAAAKPIIDKAKAALDTIQASDLNELRSFANPPSAVLKTTQACMVMFDPKEFAGAWSGNMEWKGAREFLSHRPLLDMIRGYNTENVRPAVLQRIQKYIADEEFTVEVCSMRGSQTCGSLCAWVRAVNEYAKVVKEVAPMRQAAAEAEAHLAETNAKLHAAQAQLRDVERELAELEANYAVSLKKKNDLETGLRICIARLDNAETLSGSLRSEGVRWAANIERLQWQLRALPLQAFVASAHIAYAGAFTPLFRARLHQRWVEHVVQRTSSTTTTTATTNNTNTTNTTTTKATTGEQAEEHLSVTSSSLIAVLGDPVDILGWRVHGLPSDDTSTENAIIATRAHAPSRWPLLIDPQEQGMKWLLQQYGQQVVGVGAKARSVLRVVRLTEATWLRTLEAQIRLGGVVVIDDIGETLDAALEPLLARRLIYPDGGGGVGGGGAAAQIQLSVQSGPIDYNPSFRLFLCTKLPNPTYLPEISTRVTLLNFTVTPDGLEEQMLGEVTAIAQRALEEAKNAMIESIAAGQKKLKAIEETILERLQFTKGNLLDDRELIAELKAAQQNATTLGASQAEATRKMQRISAARERYRDIAVRASVLFFVLADVARVDPMYQYSLQYFVTLVRQQVEATPPPQAQQASSPPSPSRRTSGSKDEGKASAESTNDGKEDNDKDDDKDGGDGDAAAAAAALRAYVQRIVVGLTETTYTQICRGLFNKDKPVLSLLMSTAIARRGGDVSEAEWQYFLRASALVARDVGRPPAQLAAWLTRTQWELADALARTVPSPFATLLDSLVDFAEEWRAFVQCASPQSTPLPCNWDAMLRPFQRILLLRCLREEVLHAALSEHVRQTMGAHFLQAPPFDLRAALRDSNAATPILFVLSQGADPMAALQACAAAEGVEMRVVSLGQGQGENAKRLMASCRTSGAWALLQNCHLSRSFMPDLEAEVAALQQAAAASSSSSGSSGSSATTTAAAGAVHPRYRLWLTSMPTDFFPLRVLQTSLKLTNEPPTGLRANMLRCYDAMSAADYDDAFARDAMTSDGVSKARAYRKLLYGLCFFHAIVLERKKFGPLGWNVRYEWNDTDFDVSRQWLRLFLHEQATIPWQSLEYIIGQINYGGRVTDPQDRGTLQTILRRYLTPAMLDDAFCFSDVDSDRYAAPVRMLHSHTRRSSNSRDDNDGGGGVAATAVDESDSLALARAHIAAMADEDAPEVFGMHANASLRYQLQASRYLLATIASVQPRAVGTSGAAHAKGGEGADDDDDDGGDVTAARGDGDGGGGVAAEGVATPEEEVLRKCRDFAAALPDDLSRDEAHPSSFTTLASGLPNSLSTVLSHELVKYNKLLQCIRQSLQDLQKALQGLTVLSSELDAMYGSFLVDQVPQLWHAAAYASLKPLGSWFRDLLERVSFVRGWLRGGAPRAFWLGGFYNPSAFITGIYQAFARAEGVSVDQLGMRYEVLPEEAGSGGGDDDSDTAPPARGCYVHGIHTDAWRWDATRRTMADSLPGQPYAMLPTVYFVPEPHHTTPPAHHAVPLYRTTIRAGVISSLGASSNYVLSIELPSQHSSDYWLLKGAACVCALDN